MDTAIERMQTVEGQESIGFAAILGVDLDRAYRVAGHILGNAADAEDAVQEALEKAWRGWSSIREPAAGRGWFWRILVNTCRSRLRMRHVRRGLRELEFAGEVADEDPFEASLARDAIGRAMPALTDEQRICIVLRYWGELSVPEIAARTGVPEGTVKSRLHAAMATLRREIPVREER